ncbi:hypothetical protein [Chitinophaga sp.]|uniref:hypothetical protein n=1 Tax=Chitinophaga sp. TaxID=1869181 RepID=UPI0031D2AD82
MIDPKVQELLRRYEEGLCTPDERRAVEAWYDKQASLQAEPELEDFQQLEKEMRHRIPLGSPAFGRRIRNWAIAALVMAGIGIACLTYPYGQQHISRVISKIIFAALSNYVEVVLSFYLLKWF